MKTFRVTVWILSAMAEAVDGDQAIERRVVEEQAESASMFEANIRDRYISDPDNNVWFGPISEITLEDIATRAIRRALKDKHARVDISRNVIPDPTQSHDAATDSFICGKELTVTVVGRVE